MRLRSCRVWVLWVLLLCAVLFPARAQPGSVNFHNNFTPQGSSQKAFLTDYAGALLPRGSWQLEVLDVNGALIKSGTLAVDGLFFLGVIDIPGTQPGGSGVVTLRGWDKSTGSSYSSASIRGQVLISLRNLGGGTIPAPSLGVASDFAGGVLGSLMPPWVGPPASMFPLELLGSGIQIRADLRPGPWAWRLLASGDLVNWTPIGEPDLGGYSRSWSIPNPETSTFFRVVQEPLGP